MDAVSHIVGGLGLGQGMDSKRIDAPQRRALNCLLGYGHNADPAIGPLQESRLAGSTVRANGSGCVIPGLGESLIPCLGQPKPNQSDDLDPTSTNLHNKCDVLLRLCFEHASHCV